MEISARPTLATRPRQRAGFAAFDVAREIVLVPHGGGHSHALNESSAIIWQLCDGMHTPLDMLRALRSRFEGDDVGMLADITGTLLHFHGLGLIELAPPVLGAHADGSMTAPAATPAGGRRMRFVFGVEDRPYFHWQLAIFFESLLGQLPSGWDITVVVCNDHAEFSAEMTRLLDLYGVQSIAATNHAHSHAIDYAAGHHGYVALNRVEALRAIADYVDVDDVVCLMDTDLFLFGGLREDLFPARDAMASNNIVGDRLFLGRGSEEIGIDLQKLLDALGCHTELRRGAVSVFLTGRTLHNAKVIRDCFRFAQVVYQLGKIANLPDHHVWMSEMACFAMSLTVNGIDYALLDDPQFAVPVPEQAEVAPGSFFHYYVDVNDRLGAPFAGSHWHKQLFRDRDFLREDLGSFLAVAQTDVERRFFELAMAASRRLHGAHAN
jgi:hypothetical protein